MSRQINFFMLPIELAQVHTHLIRPGEEVSVLTVPMTSSALMEVESVALRDSGNWRKVYLARREDVNRIQISHVPKQGYFVINEQRSPVIEFSRPSLTRTILVRSRLYYCTGYFSDSREWMPPDPNFLAWAAKVLRRMRSYLKTTTYLGSVETFATPEAIAWRDRVHGEFSQL